MTSTCTVHTDAATEPGGTAVIRLSGELDGSAADVLLPAYDAAVATHEPTRVLLDFTAIDYINSTGIALVVGVLSRARAQHRAVSAAGLTDHYRQIFRITRLSDFIDVLDDRPAAVAHTAP